MLETSQVHATITNNGICPTLTASMGIGGGYIPMIVEEKDDSIGEKVLGCEHI